MNLNEFLQYCDDLEKSRDYAFYKKQDSIWTEERKESYRLGVIFGLYNEASPELLNLMQRTYNHQELIRLLCCYKKENESTELALLCKQRVYEFNKPDPSEPLIQWIADHNYLLAKPVCNTKDEVLNYPDQEQILSYVYISLKFRYRRRKNSFNQPNIEKLYKESFDKSSDFISWTLIPIDASRQLFSSDNPPRIYDKQQNKTIFLDQSCGRSFSMVLQDLIERRFIPKISFRGSDFYIYDGENHTSYLAEAVEKGKLFSWNIDILPTVTKLYSESFYDDCLWVRSEEADMTFEELCENFRDDGEHIITQMIHLQHDGIVINHLDHEYIFYDLEQYERRKTNPYEKGNGRRRVKTFKIDNARIPMDYQCKMIRGNTDIEVPFIVFVLNNFFEHKDLLEEYFQNII